MSTGPMETINYANPGIGVGPGVGVSGPHITPLRFAKLHRPQMKSVYWRHFGFPTTENDCIITKQNVVCILCHKILRNHGNTTNLRAHLQYRHKDVFKRIIEEHGIRVPPRKLQSKSANQQQRQHYLYQQHQSEHISHFNHNQQQKQHNFTKRVLRSQRRASSLLREEDLIDLQETKIKIEFSDNSQGEEISNVGTGMSADQSGSEGLAGNDSSHMRQEIRVSEDQNVLYDSTIPMTYEDDDSIDSNHFTKFEVIGCNGVNVINGAEDIELESAHESEQQVVKKLMLSDDGSETIRTLETVADININTSNSCSNGSNISSNSSTKPSINLSLNLLNNQTNQTKQTPNILNHNGITLSGTNNHNNNQMNIQNGGVGGNNLFSINKTICRDIVDLYEFQDLLVNLIVLDLRNVTILYEPGMSQFLRMVLPNIRLPSIERMESFIREMYSDKHTTLSAQMRLHSQSKPFSLSFEFWSNIEQKQFLSVYFNYLSDPPEFHLCSYIYCTVEYNKFIQFESIFENFNLINCSAALTNCDNDYCDYLINFLQSKNIPLIMSYDAVVDRCLKKVFHLPEVMEILEEIKNVILRHSTEIRSKDIEIPVIMDEFPWTYYELLKFFTESVSWPEDIEVLVSSARSIIDILKTLAMTLDTLKAEDLPLSSMLAPITTKVLKKKLAPSSSDDFFMISLKTTVADIFEKLILSNEHLTILALLDPRFHRLIDVNDVESCVQILTAKLLRLDESKNYNQDDSSMFTALKVVNSAPCKNRMSSQIRKSNLELFFDMTENTSGSNDNETNNIETDLKRYRIEVLVSLDESPFVWWQKMGNIYGSLKRLAPHFQCIPCSVKPNFRKPFYEQISDQQKRFALKGNLVDTILFLHYNHSN